MAKNRKAAEAVCLKWIEEILPGSKNTEFYKKRFAEMSDAAFDDFINKLRSGEVMLSIIAPNGTKPQLEVERNLEVAKKLGHEFFERIWFDGGNESPAYLSPVKYLIVDLPLRRQAQLLEKKISIPVDNKSIDNFTGQPTGKSKGSKISYPETQILAALNLDATLAELLKYRGGDLKGFNAMNAQISRTGAARQETIAHLGTTVKSTETLSVFLTSAHLGNTLLSK